jgi:hypothetical protein
MTDPTHMEYSIATLADMALIPPERIPAFMEELPRILEKFRPVAEAMKALNGKDVEIIAKSLIWVDDGCKDGEHDERRIEIHL